MHSTHPVAQRLRGALTRRPWLAPTTLAVLAGVLLLFRLGQPDRIMFDETYYVEDALGYLEHGVEPGFAVHPTLGKWLIAGSIWLFGDNAFGWRFAGVVAAVGVVVLTHLLARRLLAGTRSGWWLAPLAPVLLLADGLFVTQARIAMLDIFLVLFAIAGLYVLVVDRDHRRAAEGGQQRLLSLRVLAGVLLGLAIAVKWSGLLALGGAGLLTLGWELGDARGRRWHVLVGRALAITGSLVVVPALVYGISWTPWLANYEQTFTAGCEKEEQQKGECEDGAYRLGERLSGLVRYHDQILDFHLGLEATHNYRSDPLGWPVLERPVVYYWATCSAEEATATPTADPETGEVRPACEVAEGDAAEVIALGNPALWWGFLLLTPLLVGGTMLRDRRSAVPLVGWLATWLPWFAVSRTAFLFYLAPAVPLLAIGTVVALHRLGDPSPVRRTYLGAALGAAVGLAPLGALAWFDVIEGMRWVFGAGALGWALGAATGAVADHQAAQRPPPGDAPLEAWPAPAWTPPDADAEAVAEATPSTSGRWALGFVVAVLALAVYFAPLWYAVPMDHEDVRDRWWLDTWV